MKERGVIYTRENREGVRSGIKTNTRRVIVPQPTYIEHLPTDALPGDTAIVSGEVWRCSLYSKHQNDSIKWRKTKPRYSIGDRMYLQEPYQITDSGTRHKWLEGVYLDDGQRFYVEVSIEELRKVIRRKKPYARTSSMFMYKSLARDWFTVTGVRVERVQDISEADAKAEGAMCVIGRTANTVYSRPIGTQPKGSYYDGFHDHWDSINAKRGYSWEKNSWVWAIEFEKEKP